MEPVMAAGRVARVRPELREQLAAADRDFGWDHMDHKPRFFQVLDSATAVPVNRYSFETMELLKDNMERWAKEISAARARAPGPTFRSREFKFYPIQVRFNNLADAEERKLFKTLPSGLNLPGKIVDRLRTISARELNSNEIFQGLLRDLQADSGEGP